MRLLPTLFAVLSVLLVVGGCGQSSHPDFTLDEQGIKALDASISSVNITDQIDGKTKLVELTLMESIEWGGQPEWNKVAGKSHTLMSALLSKDEVSRVRLIFYAPELKLDWAQVRLNKANLPPAWRDLTYLQFFALTKPMSGTLESGRWLCDFYRKYKSANPPADAHLAYCSD